MALCSYIYAHWKLNESSGSTVSDSSGNGRNGTINSPSDTQWLSGKLGNCLLFKDAWGYVDCGNIADWTKAVPFTLEFWVKSHASTANYQTLFSKMVQTGITRGWWLYHYSNKLYLQFVVTGGGRFTVRSSNNYNDQQWHHIIITYDGSGSATGVRIYLDGVQCADVVEDVLSGDINNAASFQISGRDTIFQTYYGYIDNVLLYTKVLSQSEVNIRYNAGNGRESVEPDIPVLISPSDGTDNVAYMTDIEWSCNDLYGDGLLYDIYLDTVNPPVTLIQSDYALSIYSIGPLDSLQDYYWKIVAKDSCDNEVSSTINHFKTRNEPPIIPHTPNPNNYAINQNIDVTLQWQSGDANPDDTVTYDIYFGLSNPPPLIKVNHATTSYNISSLLYNRQYHWKIIARDSNGAESIGPLWSFSTKEEPVGNYEVLEPREIVRTVLTDSYDINDDGIDDNILQITDSNNNTFKIPIYLSEEIKSDVLPTLPFIELGLLSSYAEPQDICAATRKNEAIIDIHIWFAATDAVDAVDFMKKVCDKINSYIRTYQSTVTGIHFMNLRNTGRVMIETHGRQVVYHRVMELYCLYYSEAID